MSAEREQVAHFEVRLDAIDKPTARRRWNGGPMASREASEALEAGVEAFRAALRERGFDVFHSGYGVRATHRDDDALDAVLTRVEAQLG